MMAARRHESRITGALRRWSTVLALTVLWALLWGDFTPGTLLAGVIAGIVVVVVMPMPAIAYHGRIRLWYLLTLLIWFHLNLIKASVTVAILALDFRRTPRSGIVRVQLRSSDDFYMTAVAEISSLLPGSLVVESHRLTGTLYLHVLDMDTFGGAEGVRADTLDIEARVLRAMGSSSELKAYGLTRRKRIAKEVG